MLLRVKSNNERWDVDDLLADSNVALDDQNSGVVNRLGKTGLEHLGLQTSLQKVLDLEGEHVIETHAGFVEHTDSDQTSDNGVTFEQSLGVLVVKLKQFSGSTTNLGECQGNAPDLSLVTETVFTSELKLTVESGGLERSARNLGGLGLLSGSTRHIVCEKAREGGHQYARFYLARVIAALRCLDQVTHVPAGQGGKVDLRPHPNQDPLTELIEAQTLM